MADLSRAQLEQRRDAPTTHGAYNLRQIKAKARAHRRRFLRHAGLKAGDLDAIELAYLDGWARANARVDLFDADDRPRELKEYFAALNSARLSMAKLEQRMGQNGRTPAKATSRALREHLEEHYAGDESEGGSS